MRHCSQPFKESGGISACYVPEHKSKVDVCDLHQGLSHVNSSYKHMDKGYFGYPFFVSKGHVLFFDDGINVEMYAEIAYSCLQDGIFSRDAHALFNEIME